MSRKKLRIGIWCDYGFTLEPSEGIGVFVDNLARGLVRADPNCQLTMMAHAGQEHKLDSTVARGLGRIRVISAPRVPQPQRFVIRWVNKLRRRLSHDETSGERQGKLARRLDKWSTRLESVTQQMLDKQINGCDVWLLPYVGLEKQFAKPTVVVIHDLVCYHFPEMLSPHGLLALKNVVNRISNEATLATCMSQFICDNDLYGMLDLPPSRVRVLKSAVPDDLGFGLGADETTEVEKEQERSFSERLSSQGVTADTPYLFYPAAFRSYKNHALLISAVGELKTRLPKNWKVVFTGIRDCPAELSRQMTQLGVERDVVTLGKVSRLELSWLYKHAFATVVPSLYEQGSFPVMEALHCGCPALASNIPSLREQFASMGESMLFFDPHDPSDLVSQLESLATARDSVIAAQQAGFAAMRSNTWEAAAEDWLHVFREAVELGSPIANARQTQAAA